MGAGRASLSSSGRATACLVKEEMGMASDRSLPPTGRFPSTLCSYGRAPARVSSDEAVVGAGQRAARGAQVHRKGIIGLDARQT
jgi:hypothetical protein